MLEIQTWIQRFITKLASQFRIATFRPRTVGCWCDRSTMAASAPNSYLTRLASRFMGDGSTIRWGSLERASPMLFLLGGSLVVGHAAFRGLEAFTDIAPPVDLFAPTGYLIALVGLLGLYPAISDRTPRVARVAVAVASIPFAGWIAITASSVGAIIGVVPPQTELLPGVVFVVHIVGMILTYSLFGVAVLRSGGHRRAVGVLLFVVPTLFISMVAGAVLMGNSAVGAFVIGCLLALTHLAIGYSLQTGRTAIDHETTADIGAAT